MRSVLQAAEGNAVAFPQTRQLPEAFPPPLLQRLEHFISLIVPAQYHWSGSSDHSPSSTPWRRPPRGSGRH
jgi:hypothetical protein